MEEERYEILKDLGSGNFGVTRLAKDKKTGELVAIKYIERGYKIDENVPREIVNHRSLRHPNIIKFKEVFVTPTHLAIVLEYAAGGELFDRIASAGRLSEDEARFFFQQLISGVSYCHSMEICHRDLKLENTLLDGSPAPRVKICDFGFSKSSLLHSQPKSTVGTPAYVAPEVLSRKEYDGKIADVWSCGVTLYVMLVGSYPFEDPEDPRNFRAVITIRASALLVPEGVDLQGDREKYLFSYSIRMSLQPQGCVINGMSHSSCQLYWRHWIIRANDAVVSDVNGEAVIGMHPLLRPGDKEFVYQSCSPLPTSSGSIEGSFTFVPGRLVDPRGDPFLVQVAHFPLQLPDYIF